MSSLLIHNNMKQIINILIFIFFTFTYSQAQSVSIICTSGNCYNTDPSPVAPVYSASTIDGAYSTGWKKAYQWDAFGDGLVSNSGSQTTPVYWNNTPNSPIKKIGVTVTYTNNTTYATKVIKTSTTVIVKYIGPITSINIPSASPTNPSNGASCSVPCGVQTITISVPTPATDPASSVVYTWSLPSGWSGSSTSNSITTTTDVGISNGTLSVKAKRSDGTVSQTYSVSITRPRVESANISSIAWSPDDKPLCGSETRQLSGTSSANATNFSWSATGGTTITAGANQSIVTVRGTTNGTLTLAASNACSVTKTRTWNIYAGVPQVASSEVLVDGHPNYYPNYTSGSSYISLQGGGACQTYKWELFGGSGYFYPGYCGSCSNVFNSITFNDCNSGNASTTSSMAIRVRTANRCGQGVDVIIPLQTTGTYRLTSPNPATSTVSVELDKEASNTLKSLKLVSANRSTVARNFDVTNAQKTQYFSGTNLISFDVANLERGTYYLLLTFGANNKTYSEMIVLH